MILEKKLVGKEVVTSPLWRQLRRFDLPFLGAMLLLLTLGLTVLFSTNPEAAKQQVIFAGVGLVLYLGMSFLDYRAWRFYASFLYLLALLLLVLVILTAPGVKGSVRWLNFGVFNLQPSELAKFCLTILLAKLLTPFYDRWLKLPRVITSLLLTLPIMVLVFLQPDFGMTLIISGLWLGMIFYAGLDPRHFVGFLLLGGIISFPFWNLLKPYQQERLVTFFNPYLDPLGSGYHVLQSTIAVGSGGLLGRGFGRGTQSHLKFLPEHYTDFVFASYAEEWGFLGSAIMLLLFAFMCWRILKIASCSMDDFGAMLCIGVLMVILLQVLINVGMNLGIMPITGLTLPLISYGGSSLITVMMSLGLVQSVARSRRV